MILYAIAAYSFAGPGEKEPIEFHPLWQMMKLRRKQADPDAGKMTPTESVKMLAQVFCKGPIAE